MILLGKSYAGYASGTIVQLPTPVEASLVAQGLATVSAGPVTPGAVTTSMMQGRVGIAAGQSSVVITNPAFTTETKFTAVLSNAAADTTALYVARITPASGSVTISVNANATAAVAVDWAVLLTQGNFPSP